MDDWRGATAASGARSEAGLVLLYAEDHQALRPVYVLDREVVLVGRDKDAATIVIPQRAVSRVHARLAIDAGRWTIRDLGSRNRIVVDGRTVEHAILEDGTEVRVGDAIFKFVSGGAPAYAPYGIDGRIAEGARRSTIPGAVGGLNMAAISAQVERIAPGDLSVLVLGETGTGKELVARALHAMSHRSGAFRGLNCASLPPNLVESELFGYKRGAFTGATRDHVGVVRAANGGTLLLDEIGDMPLEAQAKLLRVLETREVVPVGAVTGERVDVRIVGATHRDLRSLVESGHFRADLYARLNGYTITLPPLRARKEDAYQLVRHWLATNGAADRPVSFRFMLAVCHYDWPYNVRELAAAVKRALTLADRGPLDAPHLPEPILEHMRAYGAPAPDETRPEAVPAASVAPPAKARSPRPDAARLAALLAEHRGNVSAVARTLQKDRALVNRWIRDAGLDPEAFRNA